MAKYRNVLGGLALCALVAAVIFAAQRKDAAEPEHVKYIDFITSAEQGEVAEVNLADKAKLTFTLKGSNLSYTTDNPRNPELKEKLLLLNVDVIEGGASAGVIEALFSVMLFVGVIFFVYRNSGRTGMKSVMALSVSDSNNGTAAKLNFTDVAGNDEAKDSAQDLVDFLKNPEKYEKCGARMPRGVLFYGPPGTGKTLMAKAVAGEAGVPFFAVSGSDFVQMFVGVGASRVRDLFKKARESKRAVIFIDEIDALGKKRSASPSGGNDERDQTLNALLTEMSGFSSGQGIIVIAATNRLDTLDEALLRPGRFDRQVEIGLPDVSARKRILEYHAAGKPLAEDVDLSAVAADTVYFSGAMLENLLNEAAIFAAKDECAQISQSHLDRAYYTILAGSEKKDRSGIRERDRRITAYHEAGHALVAKIASPENTVSKVSIIPSSKGAGGFCLNIPPDKMYYTKKELEAQIMVSLGGRAAEQLVFGDGDITTGASNDIEKASAIAKDYISKYGMSEKIGLICGELIKDVELADGCRTLVSRLYDDCIRLLREKHTLLDCVATALLTRESLNALELDKYFQES